MLISEFVREPRGIVTALMAHGKGLLAADESTATITSRFKPFAIEPTGDPLRAWTIRTEESEHQIAVGTGQLLDFSVVRIRRP